MENVILIGFMGSGKTSCGKALAALADVNFCDTDEMIEVQQKMTINEIFSKYGEPYFRELETNLAKSLINTKTGVLSVGGGLPVTEGNGDILKKIGKVVYLKADKKCLVERLKNDNTRPLLAGGDLEEKISTLMKARESSYIEAADIIIDTDGLSVSEVAAKIFESVS